ncbi:MAG: hypothetical protein EAZ08_07510 [Cytophagales bacterium]|nr:MAG: hypothetical protein EAZ08_07510 [Cytophagales bacterium]
MPEKPIIFLAFANDKVDNARYLRNLPMEMSGIRKSLYEAEDAGLCEVIERANVTIEDILDTFQDNRYKDRIAIFHYGGHADGYQLLLEQLDGSHSVAHGAGLVSFLARQKGLKLIFFNGCSTQQQALELVQGGVPIVIGTSQAISDDIATTLSIRFYSGIANGASLERAWVEAIDLIKIQKGGDNVRGLYRKTEQKQTEDRVPWEMHVKAGAEITKEWNLPEAVENPLFGLPEISAAYDLPDDPFIFLGRYERRHAEVFFGRSYYIRDLYNRIASKNSSPVILLYGQSGVGKSSLLDAGLMPRLENEYHVTYIRRIRDLGLSGTLRQALEYVKEEDSSQNQDRQINTEKEVVHDSNFLRALEQVSQLESIALNADEELQGELLGLIQRFKKKKSNVFTYESKRHRFEQAKAVAQDIRELQVNRKGANGSAFAEKRFQQAEITKEDDDSNDLLKFWKAKEKKLKKPVIIILDQVEEVFTQANFALPEELEMFLDDLDMIFKNPQNRPQGKIILSYRKEYHPEIEELLKIHAIPKENIFLTHLDRKDIADVVTGLVRTEKLKKKYQLEIQEKLPEIIADDMLEDKDSSIAPVLQILLTKMWNMIAKDDYKVFSVDKYQELRKEGVLLGDFFYQQMGKLRAWNPEIEQTGLALDLLNFHTTELGTADTHDIAEIGSRYGSRSEVLDLILVCKDLYLLTDRSSEITGLAHDTLAPLIQNEYKNSDRAGQRAARILESKMVDFEDNKKVVIDEMDLGIVEVGAKGMRAWKREEIELIAASQKQRDRKVFLRRVLIFSIFIVTVVIAGLGVYANQEKEKAELRREDAERLAKIADFKEKQAVAARDSFLIQRVRAEGESKRASKEQERALEAATEAERQADIAKEQTRIAQDSTASAKKERENAETQTYLAKENEFQASLTSRQSEQKNVEAKLGEFTAKAKEMAILSIAQNENLYLKSRMAITSFLLQKNGIKNAVKNVNEIKIKYETVFKEEQKETPAYKKSLRLLSVLQDRLDLQASFNTISPEIFSSLRQAYIAENSDVLQQRTESWALAFTKDNELIFNTENGINKGLLIDNPDGLPKLRGVEKLNTDKMRLLPRNLIATEKKLFCSTAEGKIIMWDLQNAGMGEVLMSQQNGSILSMTFSETKNCLFYTIKGNLYKYDLQTKKPISLLNHSSPIRQICLIEDEKNSFLITADEQGTIQAINTSEATAIPKILYQQANKAIYSLVYMPTKDCIMAGDVSGRIIVVADIKMENLLKNNFVPKTFSDKKHKGIVRTLTLSKDGKYLATGGWDGSFLLWETPNVRLENMFSVQPILEIKHESKILAIQFDNKGDYLFFSDENEIHICPTNPQIFYDKICKKIKQQKEEPKEWKDFYSREGNEIIRSSDCKCTTCQ